MNDPDIEKSLLKAISPVCDYCGENKSKLYHRAGHTVCYKWETCTEKDRLYEGYNARLKDYAKSTGPAIILHPDGTRETL